MLALHADRLGSRALPLAAVGERRLRGGSPADAVFRDCSVVRTPARALAVGKPPRLRLDMEARGLIQIRDFPASDDKNRVVRKSPRLTRNPRDRVNAANYQIQSGIAPRS